MNTPDAISERSALLDYLGQRNLSIKGMWQRKEIGPEAARLWLAESSSLLAFIGERRRAHEREWFGKLPDWLRADGGGTLYPHERGLTGEPERRSP